MMFGKKEGLRYEREQSEKQASIYGMVFIGGIITGGMIAAALPGNNDATQDVHVASDTSAIVEFTMTSDPANASTQEVAEWALAKGTKIEDTMKLLSSADSFLVIKALAGNKNATSDVLDLVHHRISHAPFSESEKNSAYATLAANSNLPDSVVQSLAASDSPVILINLLSNSGVEIDKSSLSHIQENSPNNAVKLISDRYEKTNGPAIESTLSGMDSENQNNDIKLNRQG